MVPVAPAPVAPIVSARPWTESLDVIVTFALAAPTAVGAKWTTRLHEELGPRVGLSSHSELMPSIANGAATLTLSIVAFSSPPLVIFADSVVAGSWIPVVGNSSVATSDSRVPGAAAKAGTGADRASAVRSPATIRRAEVI